MCDHNHKSWLLYSIHYCYFQIHVTALEIRAAMILLPFLLPEAIVATRDRGKSKGQRRTYYKPSTIESQSWFVEVQKVKERMGFSFIFINSQVVLD